MDTDYELYRTGEKVMGHPNYSKKLPSGLSREEFGTTMEHVNPFRKKHPRLYELMPINRFKKANDLKMTKTMTNRVVPEVDTTFLPLEHMPYEPDQGFPKNKPRVAIMGLQKRRKGGKIKMEPGGFFQDPEGNFDVGKAFGLAPIATNLLQYGLELGREDEQFQYPTVELEEYEELNPEPAARNVKESFATAMNALGRSGELSPAAMIQLATEEEKALNKTYRSYNDQNVMGRNRMAYINSRNQMFNAQTKAREITDRMADRGQGLTRKSMFLSGVGTNLGQLGRDISAQASQERTTGRYFDLLERYPLFSNKAGSTGGRTPLPTGMNTIGNNNGYIPLNYFDEIFDPGSDPSFSYEDMYQTGAPRSGF
jgi:hypothetical protein